MGSSTLVAVCATNVDDPLSPGLEQCVAFADSVIGGIASRQHRVVAAWQLAPRGVDRHAVRRRVADGRLRPVHRGIYAVGSAPLDRRGAWMAATLAGGRDAVLSHRDAAGLWDLRPSNRRAIDVTSPGSARRGRRGIAVHRAKLHAEDRTRLHGIPVTSLPRTLLDLAAVLDPMQVQRAYERAELLRLLDIRPIKRLLARSNGHRGAGVLRGLLGYDPAAAAAALSEPERLLLDLVRARGLPTPQVNVLVEGFLVDAYWPDAGLVVEVQSHRYHSGRSTFERDHVKLAALKGAGLEVLPVTGQQLERDAAGVASLLGQLMGRRDRRQV